MKKIAALAVLFALTLTAVGCGGAATSSSGAAKPSESKAEDKK